MTATDVTEILRKLDSALDRLARIEERTNVLTDHETRIRAAEEAARVASETAVRSEELAKAHAARIRTLEDNQNTSGRFTWTTVGKVTAGLIVGIVGVVQILERIPAAPH